MARDILPLIAVLVAASSVFIRHAYAAPVGGEDGNEGCYHMLEYYNNGDQIRTNEPCLNCTCSNSSLRCFLKTCPYTKPIGLDCVVERIDSVCCPIIRCPEVPVMIPATERPSSGGHFSEIPGAVKGGDGGGDLGSEGCVLDDVHYSDGAQVPSSFNEPCELCYCIRNRTACVIQECTLNVTGCSPQFRNGVCCPASYNCDSSFTTTTTTTTTKPVQGCVWHGGYYDNGANVPSGEKCSKCYCLHGTVTCAVRDCVAPAVGCVPVPSDDKCCPQKYECPSASNGSLPDGGSPSVKEGQEKVDTIDSTTPSPDIQPEVTAGPEEPLTTNRPATITHHIVASHIPVFVVSAATTPQSQEESHEEATEEPSETTQVVLHWERETTSSQPQPDYTIVTDDVPQTPASVQGTTSSPGDIQESRQPVDSSEEDEDVTVEQSEVTSATDLKDFDVATTQSFFVTEEPVDTTEVTSEVSLREVTPKGPEGTQGAPQDEPIVTTEAEDEIEEGFTEEDFVPGEGDCLQGGITYKSNYKVPSLDPCKKNCTCRKSEIVCDRVTCRELEREVNDNCVPVFEEGLCCPKYICEATQQPTGITDIKNLIRSNDTVTEAPEVKFSERIDTTEHPKHERVTHKEPPIHVVDSVTVLEEVLPTTGAPKVDDFPLEDKNESTVTLVSKSTTATPVVFTFADEDPALGTTKTILEDGTGATLREDIGTPEPALEDKPVETSEPEFLTTPVSKASEDTDYHTSRPSDGATTVLESETSAPEIETPASESQTPAPQAETPAPEAETPAPETETSAPEIETQTPERVGPSHGIATPALEVGTQSPQVPVPHNETQAPESETPQDSKPFVQESETSAPDIATSTPEREHAFILDSETPAPESETPAPESETPAPEIAIPAPGKGGEPGVSEIETPAPKTGTQAPESKITTEDIRPFILEDDTPASDISVTLAPELEVASPDSATPAPERKTSVQDTEPHVPEIGTPAPDIDTPSPDIEITAPEVETSAPEVETSAPEVETSAPEVETTAPEVETSAPEVDTSAPEVKTSAPEVETPAPKIETPTSAAETPAPEVETPAPKIETPTSDVETPAPEVGTLAPESKISTEDPKPSVPEILTPESGEPLHESNKTKSTEDGEHVIPVNRTSVPEDGLAVSEVVTFISEESPELTTPETRISQEISTQAPRDKPGEESSVPLTGTEAVAPGTISLTPDDETSVANETSVPETRTPAPEIETPVSHVETEEPESVAPTHEIDRIATSGIIFTPESEILTSTQTPVPEENPPTYDSETQSPEREVSVTHTTTQSADIDISVTESEVRVPATEAFVPETVPTVPEHVTPDHPTVTESPERAGFVPDTVTHQQTESSIPHTEPIVLHTEPSVSHTEPSVPHSKPSVSQTEPSVPHDEPSVPHTEPSVPHDESPVSHTEPTVLRTESPVPHTKPLVSHTESSVPATKPSVPYDEPSVTHAKPSVSHTEPSVSHTKPPVSHTEPSISHTDQPVPHTKPLASHTVSSVSVTEPSVPHDQPSVSRTEPSVPRTESPDPHIKPLISHTEPSVPHTEPSETRSPDTAIHAITFPQITSPESPPATPTPQHVKPLTSTQDPQDYEEEHFEPDYPTADFGVPIPSENFTLPEGDCAYDGYLYVSAQQIPRDDPCDFCFCFRGDIICLKQSCPPPIEECFQEPIPGFCCPRFECPVTALTLNLTDSRIPYPVSSHYGRHRSSRAVSQKEVVVCAYGHNFYNEGEFIRPASGPCMDCVCGSKGTMKCIPKPCEPAPLWQSLQGLKQRPVRTKKGLLRGSHAWH